jgi:hypothetical protein
MKKHLKIVLPALLFAAIWGYFADLRYGDFGWFIGRLVFIPSVVLALVSQHQRKDPQQDKDKDDEPNA